jgi:hypothetical protein
MRRLIKWWNAEPTIRKRESVPIEPVTLASVEPAEVPNKELERQTKSALGDLAQGVITLARTNHELRSAMSSAALSRMTGGRPR